MDQLTIYYSDEFLKQFNQMLDTSKIDKIKGKYLANSIIKEILKISTEMGFDINLWKSYIIYLLIQDINPYTTTVERRKDAQGSAKALVLRDLEYFYKLYKYDFSHIEEMLNIDYFSYISNYKSMAKNKDNYNEEIQIQVSKLREKLDKTENVEEFYEIIDQFYKTKGVGIFALNKSFRVDENRNIIPITNLDNVGYDHIIGYETQKSEIIQNTQAFVDKKPANNVLLYGDSGTGKSTTIKATINHFYDQGLRMIEIYKHQLKDLNNIIGQIKNRNYRFVLYMDDLSFEEFETDYKYLKSIIEGGLEDKPENILIYATSNRRNIIKETWSDKNDMEFDNDMRRSDNQEEKLSLVHRFGITIQYLKPLEDGYLQIVQCLAQEAGIKMDQEELIRQAKIWEKWNGGKSGRTAEQFIRHLQSK